MYLIKKLLAFVFFISLTVNNSYCDEKNFVTINSIKARPLALGGAFLSVKDDLAALEYNPASFTVNTLNSNVNFSVFINPAGAVVLIKNFNNFSNIGVPIGLLVCGFSISVKRLNIGFLLGEETFTDIERLNCGNALSLNDYPFNRKSSLCFSLALAPRVSIGIAGDFYYHKINNKEVMRFGYRYGIWVKSLKNICIGLCFFDLPEKFSMDRTILERFDDETLNVGFSYSPVNSIHLSFDVRNVSDENKIAAGEPHFGLELIPWKHICFRGGYYKMDNTEVYSFGVGLLNENFFLPVDKRFNHNEFILNTAFIWEKNSIICSKWFLLSCVVRF